MKNIFIFFAVVMTTHAEINQNLSIGKRLDQDAVEFLKEFYLSYNSVWCQNLNPSQLKGKLKHLQSQYCSKKLQKELSSISSLDEDRFIAGYYANKDEIKTLKVTPLPGGNNFLVSYKVNVDNFGTKTTIVVKVEIGLISSSGKFKIDSVNPLY